MFRQTVPQKRCSVPERHNPGARCRVESPQQFTLFHSNGWTPNFCCRDQTMQPQVYIARSWSTKELIGALCPWCSKRILPLQNRHVVCASCAAYPFNWRKALRPRFTEQTQSISSSQDKLSSTFTPRRCNFFTRVMSFPLYWVLHLLAVLMIPTNQMRQRRWLNNHWNSLFIVNYGLTSPLSFSASPITPIYDACQVKQVYEPQYEKRDLKSFCIIKHGKLKWTSAATF